MTHLWIISMGSFSSPKWNCFPHRRISTYFSILLCLIFHGCYAIINPPVKCHGAVPKISEGKYYFHDNGTYLLRLSTNVELDLDLNLRSCFQVNILEEEMDSDNSTASTKPTSLFYSMRYLAYQQTYDIRTSYQFGIAELQSFCKCDCPGLSDTFCTHHYGKKYCSKGEVCVTKHHGFQESRGCPESGAANLCCELSVKPYQDRRFTAVNLVEPRPQTKLEIEIHTLFQNKWTLFRRYTRTLLPYKTNSLRLNGFENVAEMYVRATAESARFHLKNGDKYYFFEDTPQLKIYDDVRINSMLERDPAKFGWLRLEDGSWNIGDPFVNLHNIHVPVVTNCKEQKYTDRYLGNFNHVVVIRNSSGKINAEPYLGSEVSEKQRFVKTIRYSRSIFGSKRDRSFTVTFEDFAAPTLNLQIKLYQKISVVAHAFASYLENFVAQICLDKNSNRYLNITLIKSYGEFNIEVYRDRQKQDMDLILSLSTNLPLATNYSEILPLPGFVASSRLVCISASNKPSNRLCKWATFQREPVQWFILKNNFLETQGSCPGCNKETSLGGFLSNLNPKNWFNGINSFSEGIAMALEIFLYVILLIVLIGVWRRCLWPVIKWTVCNKGPKKYEIVTKKPAEV